MIAVNYSTARRSFKDYCDKVVDNDETVIVTRNGTVKWRRLKETPCICGSWIVGLLRFAPGMVS